MLTALRRWQTTAPLAQGMLSLPVTKPFRRGRQNGLVSPYFQRSSLQKIGTGRNTNHILVMLTAYYMGYGVGGLDGAVDTVLRDSNGVYNIALTIPLSVVGTDTAMTIESRVSSSVASFLIANGLTAPDAEIFLDSIHASPPMIVSGVAKSGYYPVVAAPTVAGGSGVARFYIDSNGDGTGTAPSEVETASLQAVVINTSAAYLPQSITVDTNRKYIDIKMGFLSFSTGLAGLLNVLTGASVGNAANGTTVNCLVFVKQ